LCWSLLRYLWLLRYLRLLRLVLIAWLLNLSLLGLLESLSLLVLLHSLLVHLLLSHELLLLVIHLLWSVTSLVSALSISELLSLLTWTLIIIVIIISSVVIVSLLVMTSASVSSLVSVVVSSLIVLVVSHSSISTLLHHVLEHWGSLHHSKEWSKLIHEHLHVRHHPSAASSEHLVLLFLHHVFSFFHILKSFSHGFGLSWFDVYLLSVLEKSLNIRLLWSLSDSKFSFFRFTKVDNTKFLLFVLNHCLFNWERFDLTKFTKSFSKLFLSCFKF